MQQVFGNNAASTVATAILATATSVTLYAGSGSKFPVLVSGQYFTGTFTDAATGLLTEIVWVTAISGDTLTIERAQEGTTAQNWAVGDIFALNITAGTLAGLVQSNNVSANTLPIYPPLLATGAAQTACGLWVTTGVPGNSLGNNGDYALRSDGSSGAHIYFKAAGVWSAVT